MSCGTCSKACRGEFCSNKCFRASAPKTAACATCPPGNYRSNWLCSTCEALPENAEWYSASRKEAGGFECDQFMAGDDDVPTWKHTENGRTKYDTDAARLVLKEIGKGEKLADAARVAGVSVQYAKMISAYWRKAVGIKLKAIAKWPGAQE